MLDASGAWGPAPGWSTAALAGGGVEARTLPGLSQALVSGDLAAFAAARGLAPAVGALGLARGPTYAARMARDRMLVVGLAESEIVPGWSPAGYAVTPMSAALHVFEFKGRNVLDLVGRASAIDPRDPGPCAALQFAGLVGCLYRHDDADTLRLHVDRGLAAYLWTWLQSQPLFA